MRLGAGFDGCKLTCPLWPWDWASLSNFYEWSPYGQEIICLLFLLRCEHLMGKFPPWLTFTYAAYAWEWLRLFPEFCDWHLAVASRLAGASVQTSQGSRFMMLVTTHVCYVAYHDFLEIGSLMIFSTHGDRILTVCCLNSPPLTSLSLSWLFYNHYNFGKLDTSDLEIVVSDTTAVHSYMQTSVEKKTNNLPYPFV